MDQVVGRRRMIVQLDQYISIGRGIAEIEQGYAKNDYPSPVSISRTMQMSYRYRSYLGYASSSFSLHS
jgi:hypothetical protein